MPATLSPGAEPLARGRKVLDRRLWSHRIAARIEQQRERAGLSRQQFADALGVSIKTVYAWESAQNLPNYDNLARVIRLFRLSAAEFMPPLPR